MTRNYCFGPNSGMFTLRGDEWELVIDNGALVSLRVGQEDRLATGVAPAPVPAPRSPSPSPRTAEELGGVPSPMQRRVLEALMDGGMTHEEVAIAANMSKGSVRGCKTGMMRQKRRWWIRKIKDQEDPDWLLFITERGRAALELCND